MALAAQQVDPRVLDAAITSQILEMGEDMTQPLISGAFAPNGNNNTVNVPMRQVGLTRGFLIKITATFSNPDVAIPATLTPFGAANLLSSVVVTDLDNYQRINTSGWHLNMLNTAKEGFPFGAALLASATDSPIKYGNNFNAMSASATVPINAGTGTIQMYYWVPLAYGKRDLRGALFTGVVNATAYLQFTVNPNAVITSGDTTLACYGQPASATPAKITNVSYTVYQNYIDQLPRYSQGPNRGAPVLPPISMRTQYRLVNTALGAIAPNQDFPIPFTNFQSFLSASVILDQNGVLNPGTDVAAWKMTAANTLQFFYLDAITQAMRQRVRIKTDFPLGTYMFDFREQPINTNQAGNVQIQLNASTAVAGAQVLVGWESFADVNSVLGAQSLPAS